MTGHHNIEAVIKNTPMRFKIDQEFASICHIGSVVRHHTLGPIFYEEAVIGDDGRIDKVVFIGTSGKNGLRR